MYDNYGAMKWKQVNNKFLIDDETTFLWVRWTAVLKLQRERSTASSDKWGYKEAAAHLYIKDIYCVVYQKYFLILLFSTNMSVLLFSTVEKSMPTCSTVAYLWRRIESEHQQPKKKCDSQYGMCLHLMRHWCRGPQCISFWNTRQYFCIAVWHSAISASSDTSVLCLVDPH